MASEREGKRGINPSLRSPVRTKGLSGMRSINAEGPAWPAWGVLNKHSRCSLYIIEYNDVSRFFFSPWGKRRRLLKEGVPVPGEDWTWIPCR